MGFEKCSLAFTTAAWDTAEFPGAVVSCSKYVPVDSVGAIEDVFGRLCRVNKGNPLQVFARIESVARSPLRTGPAAVPQGLRCYRSSSSVWPPGIVSE